MQTPKRTPKNKQKKKKTKKQKKSRGVALRSGPPVSECAYLYMLACADPFNPKINLSCVPSIPARPSFKTSARLRGTITCNGDGKGLILVYPCLANNKRSLEVSTPTWTGATFALGALDYIEVQAPTPRTAAQLLPTNESTVPQDYGRIVSVGLRVRYIGTELSRGGQIFTGVNSSHYSLRNMTIGEFTSLRDTALYIVDRKWHTISLSAVDTSEMEYPSSALIAGLGDAYGATILTSYPFSSGMSRDNGDIGGCPAAIYLAGCTAGAQFEYEYIVHMEYAGPLSTGQLTPSHADPVGLNMVNEAVSGSYTETAATGKPFYQCVLENFGRILVQHQHQISAGARVAASILGGLRGPRHPRIQYR